MSRPTGAPRAANPGELAAVMEALRFSGGSWRNHADLVMLTHLPRRRVQVAVSQLVRDGEPIVSGGLGFRLSSDPDEIRGAGRAMLHRAGEIRARAEALILAAERIDAGATQLTLL